MVVKIGKLTVKRKGYVRKPHIRRSYVRKDGTRVKATSVKKTFVPPTTFKIKDLGTKGRGKKVIKDLEKGKMTKTAKEMGLLKKGERIIDLTKAELRRLADRLVAKYGAKATKGMFQAQELFRKRQKDGFKSKMKATREYISEKYSKQLTPLKAIRKWTSLPSKTRKKLMPERKGKSGYKLIKGRWRKVK